MCDFFTRGFPTLPLPATMANPASNARHAAFLRRWTNHGTTRGAILETGN